MFSWTHIVRNGTARIQSLQRHCKVQNSVPCVFSNGNDYTHAEHGSLHIHTRRYVWISADGPTARVSQTENIFRLLRMSYTKNYYQWPSAGGKAMEGSQHTYVVCTGRHMRHQRPNTVEYESHTHTHLHLHDFLEWSMCATMIMTKCV